MPNIVLQESVRPLVKEIVAREESAARPVIRAGIFGVPLSSRNLGVQALGTSLAHLVICAAPATRVTFFGSHRSFEPVKLHLDGREQACAVEPWRLAFQGSFRHHLLWIVVMSLLYRVLPFGAIRRWIVRETPWIRSLVGMNVVGDVRGGDSFSDIYGLRRFLIAFLPVWTVILVKGSIIHFPQTYGPFRNPIARWLARYLLRHSSRIFARDKDSQKVAQSLAGPRKTVELSPDVAFALEVVKPKLLTLDPDLENGPSGPVIGLNVNGLMYHGGYDRANMFGLSLDYPAFLKRLIEELLEVHSGELWLVSHTYAEPGSVESDNGACQALRETLTAKQQQRLRVVGTSYNQHEIKGLIGGFDFFVGSRMHSCIAALSQGIPCVGVAYSMKFRGVFESVGMEDWVVDARKFTTEVAVAQVLSLYLARGRVRSSLLDQVRQARTKLAEIFREIAVTADESSATSTGKALEHRG